MRSFKLVMMLMMMMMLMMLMFFFFENVSILFSPLPLSNPRDDLAGGHSRQRQLDQDDHQPSACL